MQVVLLVSVRHLSVGLGVRVLSWGRRDRSSLDVVTRQVTGAGSIAVLRKSI